MSEFGYAAEGGTEFVHGDALVRRGLLRGAGLATLPIQGERWTAQDGRLSQEGSREFQDAELHRALHQLTDDVTVVQIPEQAVRRRRV
jgi:hypothetical protein